MGVSSTFPYNQEFLLADLTPPSPYHEIDLYRAIKNRFRFTSNKLDFVARQLGVGAKVQHKGMDLWKGCMNNIKKDWKVMKEYNMQDVDLLEDLYMKLRPWIQPHPNMALYSLKNEPQCPVCGSTNLQSRGTRKRRETVTTLTQVYNRWQCQDCGKWSRGKSTTLSTEERQNTLVGVK